ncbi:methionine aminopeptidase 1-like [Diaphorina citri]|uniref:Methionine aminopeptidase 1-like n=1 Tax=Diaphorina citri TaxID=121845 RepID=A0A3Q0IQC1_DIACI|nr:methionine aminopeptidase 1-like [Diaphorina citri]
MFVLSTDEIDRIVHEACVERECYPSPLNYYEFPRSCCTSVNEVICHGIPDLRPLANGDICNGKHQCFSELGCLNSASVQGISKPMSSQEDIPVRSYCGHGIHRLFHTAPSIPHYAKNKAVGVMKPGHSFTIEPMISQGSWRDELWPDKWTAVTIDGLLSAQFEHTLLVTDTGCEILTARNPPTPYFLDQNV